MGFLVFVGLFAAMIAVSALLAARTDRRRMAFIAGYEFPPELVASFRRQHPEIDHGRIPLVFQALRQWLTVARKSDGKPFAMPSRAADDAWHLFILDTRAYHDFCDDAYGDYLDHTPNAVAARIDREAMPRTLAAVNELDGPRVGGLPLLFAVDGMVGCDRARLWNLDAIAGAQAECSTGELPEHDSGGCCA